jgi:hypothetical protein
MQHLLQLAMRDLGAEATVVMAEAGADGGFRDVTAFLPAETLAGVVQFLEVSAPGRRCLRRRVRQLRKLLADDFIGMERRGCIVFQLGVLCSSIELAHLAAEGIRLAELQSPIRRRFWQRTHQRSAARVKQHRAKIARTRLRWFDRFAARFNELAELPLLDAPAAAVLLLAFVDDAELRQQLHTMGAI